MFDSNSSNAGEELNNQDQSIHKNASTTGKWRMERSCVLEDSDAVAKKNIIDKGTQSGSNEEDKELAIHSNTINITPFCKY